MGYLTMFDAVTAANIPASARYAAGYVDGQYANIPAIRAHCPHAEILSITVSGGIADCCDCESGDLTPAQAEAWVAERLKAGAWRPCVYASQDTWENQGLGKALAAYGNKVRRWVAAYPGTGANVPSGFDAHQYSDGGGHLDTSVCLDNFFDPPPKPAPKTRWASAEIQMSMSDVSRGMFAFGGTFHPQTGKWTIHGLPSLTAHPGPGGGQWRAKGMPFNSPPLGD